MDQILLNCLGLVCRRYKKYNNTIFGLVGAAIVTKEYDPVYETAMQTMSQKWKHAEHCVIEKFHRLHGELPKDAILVTTLSPCFNDMGDRDGESCSDIITKYGIKIVYSGIEDTTQLSHDEDHYNKVPFDLIITKNSDIKDLCSLLLNKISKINYLYF